MAPELKPKDGVSPINASNLFASPVANGDGVVMGGEAEDSSQWKQTLTRRAARSLWFDLTRLLFPEKSDEVIAQVSTIPSVSRPENQPHVTVWTVVDAQADGGCIITGWSGYPGWSVRLNPYEAYRFWVALDLALFPAGWSA